MPIDPKSPNIRIFFSDEETKIDYKIFCMRIKQSMSGRLKSFVEKELEYWRKYGEPIDIETIGQNKKQSNSNESPVSNGHHTPQQVKVIKPRKHHKTYRDKVGELVGELAGNQVKVSFDGEEKAFYSDEIELVETE